MARTPTKAEQAAIIADLRAALSQRDADCARQKEALVEIAKRAMEMSVELENLRMQVSSRHTHSADVAQRRREAARHLAATSGRNSVTKDEVDEYLGLRA